MIEQKTSDPNEAVVREILERFQNTQMPEVFIKRSWAGWLKENKDQVALLTSALLTVVGNAGYVVEYGNKALDPKSVLDGVASSILAVTFFSFFIEKCADLGVYSIDQIQQQKRLSNTSESKGSSLALDYKPAAGLWLAGNQLTNGVGFFLKGLAGDSASFLTATFRMLATTAAGGAQNVAYKKHPSPEDLPRVVQSSSEVVDNVFGPFVRACGKNFNWVALGFLTGPHVWKLGVELYKNQPNPSSLFASATTALGYGALASYFALHQDSLDTVKDKIKTKFADDLVVIDNLLHTQIKELPLAKMLLEQVLCEMTDAIANINLRNNIQNSEKFEEAKSQIYQTMVDVIGYKRAENFVSEEERSWPSSYRSLADTRKSAEQKKVMEKL